MTSSPRSSLEEYYLREEALARRARILLDERRNVLTDREAEILDLIAHGGTNTTISKKLFIASETVKSHVKHILSKLDSKTRSEAVAKGMRAGIIK